ncbi:DUF1501 domain-containing protein [Urbifossiella limnaea]|uniref:DUF1501 domain-containing protein n=1 Tax=Urbifossiella limnaea TaxID=2528023 RepID=A0A517Y155_9BACT|nr:DUF1501 domain-containing protein [Urbifossiella limnaea]QDU23502.1 hypothetical protein ETAA1_55020 [Urbifossiella limnaea]
MVRPDFALNRRAFLGRYAGALGPLALASLAADAHADPLAPKRPHHAAKAKAVICLFQHGGPSQMDLFDPKPELTRRNGQPHPEKLEVHFHTQQGKLLASPFRFARRGNVGVELSELLPHTAGIVDDITLVRSMTTDSVDHEAALRVIHSGKIFAGRPAWGSWVLYGLGTERKELPAYVVLGDPGGLPVDGTNNWSSGFLPAVYQGTPFRAAGTPVAHLATPADVPAAARRHQLDLLRGLNAAHLQRHAGNAELEARLGHFELAAAMQTAVPDVLDLSRETEETKRLYGIDDPKSAEYGRRCLLARRLVERGVRFVQLFLSGQPWDTHSRNAENLRNLCAMTDRPSAGLVTDLKRRGLLDDTIVMWAGEFGRLPISQGTDGRDHNRHAFTLWLAGGGFKRGYVHGATDEFGYRSVEKVVRVPSLHATLLHALGLDHTRLTVPHEGRDDTLTDYAVTNAAVVRDLLA